MQMFITSAGFVSLQATNLFDKDFILIDIKYICVCVLYMPNIQVRMHVCVPYIKCNQAENTQFFPL